MSLIWRDDNPHPALPSFATTSTPDERTHPAPRSGCRHGHSDQPQSHEPDNDEIDIRLGRRSAGYSQRSRIRFDRISFLVILLTMTTLPLGEVKTHLSELVSRVHDHHERVTVTVHGRPSAVLVATEDLERLEETLAILRDSETVSRLAASDAELARGESVSAEELAEAMRRRPAQG
jgi:antitoxin YefM